MPRFNQLVRRVQIGTGRLFPSIIFLATVFLLYLLSQTNYLFFHALVEGFSIVVACGIFMLTWNTRKLHQSGFFICLGVASVFVACNDFLHVIAYKGMGVFPHTGADLATQLWLTGRFIQVSALVLAPFLLNRKVHPTLLFCIYLILFSLLAGSVFSGIFPTCFQAGTGLTIFKIVAEYVLCLALVLALYVLRKNRHYFARRTFLLTSLAIWAFIFCELSFTLYQDVFGFFNMAGHLFKLAGYYFIYRGVVEAGLTRPFEILFRDLQQSEERLQFKSKELETANAELLKANAKLEVSNADLEAFNYTISHDLRRPLTVISCQCQLIEHLHSDRVDHLVLESLAAINDQALQMADMIKALLDFSHFKEVELHRQKVDLTPMALHIADSLKHRSERHLVDFHIADGLTVEADPELLRILLGNLLENAWKYTMKAAAPKVEMGKMEREGHPVFFVRDNGVGFDPGRAKDLFIPFQRLHSHREFEGSGIGLATTKRIVDRHGGRIWAESAPGQGAVFYFSF